MTENMELALTNEQALAMLNDLDLTPRGYDEHVRAEDVAQPPRLRIAQRGSEEMPAGTLYNSLTGKQYGATVEAVFLLWETDTAIMWPIKFDKDNDPLCGSDNGKSPNPSTERRPLTNPQRGPCSVCPSHQFGADGESPRCSRQRNCIVWLVDDNEPIRLTLQRSSIPTSKTLTNLGRTCNVRKSIYITSKFEDNDKGQYYIYLFTEGKKQPPTLSFELYQLAQTIELNMSADLSTDLSDDSQGYAPGPDAQVIDHTAVENEVPF